MTTHQSRLAESTQKGLFDGDAEVRAARTRNSVLWAAYGDALGFISELVSAKGLRQRTDGAPLDRLMAWKRRIGGRAGVQVRLPSGSWSDDTQFRMAVSRAISHRGFDVESFARVELTVWPSYALGGGRASKAAAKNLGKPAALWYANTFPRWFEAGGNGAAMRIQPHVWAAPDLNDYMVDVITDSVCTHGHLRAIVGACFHAATLAYCLDHGTVPDLDRCAEIADGLTDVPELIESHPLLGSTWVGLWEEASQKKLRQEWENTVSELVDAIGGAVSTVPDGEDSAAEAYRGICDRLGLQAAHQRGSGILTTVAAVALAGLSANTHEAVVTAANAIGTDTDTIGTMVGALVGACHTDEAPPQNPLDHSYLLAEAARLVAISEGRSVDSHQYPDLLTWTAPRTHADALVGDNGQLTIKGLGPVTEIGEPPTWTPRGNFGWQWVQTVFGQTILVKRRPDVSDPQTKNQTLPASGATRTDEARLPRAAARKREATGLLDRGVNIDRAVDYARSRIRDDRQLGYTVREVARRGNLADLVAFTVAIREYLRRPTHGHPDGVKPPRPRDRTPDRPLSRPTPDL